MAGFSPAPSRSGVGHTSNTNYAFAQTILTSLFFMWGFLTCLNDILIPHLKAVFDLNYTQVMMTQFCFFFAYFIVSLPSGKIVEKIGYQRGIVVGLLIAGLGTLLFYPAAGMRSYTLFLVALFVLAAGITILQVSANPYVTILGKPEYASSRLNLTQAFNSLGTTIAPYLGSLFILSVAVKSAAVLKILSPVQLDAYKQSEAASVQNPYLILSVVLLVIAGVFSIIKLPKVSGGVIEGNEIEKPVEEVTTKSAWSHRHLVLGAIGIFTYVGAEVSIGSFLVNYLGQPYVAGLREADAGKFVSFYWGGAMLGRFLGAWIQRYIKPGKVLAFNAFIAGILVVTTMLSSGQAAMWSVLAVGLFNSIMFPTIFSLALNGLGKHTGQGSGILCMAIVGGAIIPVLQGIIADQIGIHHAFILPVLCYIFIAYYGIIGYKPRLSN
jgi:MFS transporter, FHS family, L-fucose permease